ncbi:hypothetical protein ABE65_012400 [Fictibacillus phosphorivorans]|uniref:Uncharacterized protein n=1 Tax=Fictibacillus phosphorivorans TaxID=1221500 RepID=A0A160IMY9_9BACL|nr:hypothetical protein [Fictibacillus phosphorivorans]ANC77554.1 hypothetical protein ABE65_012400 [Fictibacillus phosphorivorans]
MKYIIFVMFSLVSWWMFFVWIFSHMYFVDQMDYGAFLYTSVFAFSPYLSATVTYFTYKFCVKSKSILQVLTMIYILTSIYGIDQF